MDIEKLLLSRSEYKKAEQKYGQKPVIFRIKKGKQILFYFGANHSPNPADPQYPILKKNWNEFLTITDNKDRVVLVEGRLRPIIENEKMAIASGSEGNLITLLAYKAGVPVICPDINDEDMYHLSHFNQDEILLYFFLKWFNHYHRHIKPMPNLETLIKKWCINQKKKKMWQNKKISLKILKQIYRQILNKNFDKNKNPNNLINPNKTGTIINKIARAQSHARDINIVTKIAQCWNEGKSIFVVFGHGHLIIQKPALKKILNKKVKIK